MYVLPSQSVSDSAGLCVCKQSLSRATRGQISSSLCLALSIQCTLGPKPGCMPSSACFTFAYRLDFWRHTTTVGPKFAKKGRKKETSAQHSGAKSRASNLPALLLSLPRLAGASFA